MTFPQTFVVAGKIKGSLALSITSLALILSACESSPEIGGPSTGDGDGDSGDGDSGDGDIGDGDFSLGGMNGDGDGDETPVLIDCGNGQLEPLEICDDGNEDDDDGCAADCQSQDPDYLCLEPGEPCENTVICGNGILEGDEACDDDNEADDDGCSGDCSEVGDGYQCTRPGRPCVKISICGNGERERGEQCDDGEATPESGDGCSAECQLEEGFFCATPGEPCVALLCGDGNRTPDEECDDEAPAEDGDGCSALCTTEDGYRCGASGCKPICGDGVIVSAEVLQLPAVACDDGNRSSGDGCSAACVEEPFYDCSMGVDGSECESTIECGNDVIDPGEICDPPGEGGCLAGCDSFSPEIGGGATCPNNVVELGEECDGPSVPFPGCTAGCQEVAGWTCIRPGECLADPICGDGILHSPLGEACDDGNGNPNDGCDDCGVTTGYNCYGLQPSICVQEVCGDEERTPGEECEDGNGTNGDGCTGCVTDDGWACPIAGENCVPRCGDGWQVGAEQCDDGNSTSGDGCNAACRIEPRYDCTAANDPPAVAVPSDCELSECGDGVEDPSEGCDDGNAIAGDSCGPTCQLEPTVTVGPNPVVNVFCGDGLVTSGEECDDGNSESGDGCDDECDVETDNFTCDEFVSYPDAIEMVVTYRDFKVAEATGGNPDFNYAHGSQTDNVAGAACTTALNVAGTCGKLDDDGKPQGNEAVLGTTANQSVVGYAPGDHGASRIRSPGSFAVWYRDPIGTGPNPDHNELGYEGYNGVVDVRRIDSTLTLERQGTTDAYVFDSDDPADYNGLFNPLDRETGDFGPSRLDPGAECGTNGVRSRAQRDGDDNQLCGNGNPNYSFSTELRYYFQYSGGETLVFSGDDDVWVFINGRVAVDIGGMHGRDNGRVVLGDDGWVGNALAAQGSASGQVDSNCSVHGGGLSDIGVVPRADGCYSNVEHADTFDSRFGLQKGGVYEIVLFQAERHVTGSNFKLTLDGFLAPRSYCTPICGDGIVGPGEVCDDGPTGNGNSDDNDPTNDVSGECNDTCSERAYCGDNKINMGETCDNGQNLTLYSTGALGECAPGCVEAPYCGDDTVQAAYESCDNGSSNDDDSYGSGSCTTSCGFGGFCGDSIENGEEACDKGALNGKEYGNNSCGYDCQPGPRCGDGVRQGEEQCDGTPNCEANCMFADEYCGDGVPNGTEECDWGQFASDAYGACDSMCHDGPSCGDGEVEEGIEECDDGLDDDDALYDGCTQGCFFGPRCGDAIVQEDSDETCDNGFNDDPYAFTESSCGVGCLPPPSCGDGVLQSTYELCDEGSNNSDAAYEGCTSTCDWGPYCGDGIEQTEESCDDGADNTAYSVDGEACGYDCEPAPYCGDGERNGPEQCDEGTDNNDGAYGGCKANCTRAPFCGDGITQEDEGEDCDGGPAGTLDCTPRCGVRGVVK